MTKDIECGTFHYGESICLRKQFWRKGGETRFFQFASISSCLKSLDCDHFIGFADQLGKLTVECYVCICVDFDAAFGLD